MAAKLPLEFHPDALVELSKPNNGTTGNNMGSGSRSSKKLLPRLPEFMTLRISGLNFDKERDAS